MRASLGSSLVLAVALAGAPGAAAAAPTVPPGFTITSVMPPELHGATGGAWAPDGSNRLFVIRQGGEVLVVKDGVVLGLFTLVEPIYSGSECGLTGIAFDPDFLTTKHVYFMVCVSNSEQQIVRYTVSGNMGTEKTTVVAGLPTVGNNHDGGGLGFGPDGKLYWSIGDLGYGGGLNDDLTSLASKVGRANLDGTVPADNPFADGSGPNNDFIWARGFRNPFTLTFQPTTGLLWLNVVGTAWEQVFVVRKGDHGGWNAHEGNQPAAGFIAPVVRYRTNSTDIRTLAATAGAVRAGGMVTFTTEAAHSFVKGEKLTVGGVADPSFHGDIYVASVGPKAVTAAQAGADATSGGGALTTQAIGGCITGGTFAEATGFSAAHRGNFFFGDYNSNVVVRAALDPASNTVTAVDTWATELVRPVDVELGPDGALHVVGHVGHLYRIAPEAAAQGLVVSPSAVRTAEGQPVMVNVRLALAPASDVTVTAARTGGDAEVSVLAGGTLTFTSANWSVPQAVTLAAGRDLDAADDLATISFTADTLAAQTAAVYVRDDNGLGLVVSAAALALEEGKSGSVTVALSRPPSLDVQVVAARLEGDADVTVSAWAALTFTRANWSTPQAIAVTAAEDADAQVDSARIGISAAGLPAHALVVTVSDDDPPPPEVPDAGAPDVGADAAKIDPAAPLDAARDAPAASSDAGTDAAAGAVDTGALDAAGERPAGGSSGGCDCRVSGPGGSAEAPALLLAGLYLLVASRRRRARGLVARR
jgi:MYXO-CTERM domain-containing protein